MNTSYNLTATYREASANLSASVTKCKNYLSHFVPPEHRDNLLVRTATATAVAFPMLYLSSFFAKDRHQEHNMLKLTVAIIITIDWWVRSHFANNQSKEIKQIIEESRLQTKEGVALILKAPKMADHNFAFAEGEYTLRNIKILAKRFFIELKTIATPQQAAEAIEEVCKTSSLPVKVVYILGHGTLQAVLLGRGQELRANNQRLIEALKKTDASAHIILQSCSTGKLRSAQGISIADQLSLNVPGRTVTGNSADAGAGLLEHQEFPQGISLYNAKSIGWNSVERIPSHSFCVKGNERSVSILAPLPINPSDSQTIQSQLIEKHKTIIVEDNKFKTEGLNNKYTIETYPAS